MSFKTYEQLEAAMNEYFSTSDKRLLADIQQVASKVGYAQMEIRKKLELYPEYLSFFNKETQAEIILDILEEAKKKGKKKKFHIVVNLLLETSDDVRIEVLQYSPSETILLIMEYIQKNIDKIGKSHCDTSHKPVCDNTTFFSRREETKEWNKLLKVCEAAAMTS